MSKLTLLCGPPQSGKTAVGIKIAQEIYYHFKGSVIYISADTVTPFMGLVFPNASEKQLYSLGEALEHTSITKENVLRHTVPLPKAERTKAPRKPFQKLPLSLSLWNNFLFNCEM